MRLTDLASYLRGQGLTVVEAPGWKTRGADLPVKPDTVIVHHTATTAQAPGDLPTLRLLVAGRSDLPGPLSQLALSRSGVVHCLAAGKANHAGRGEWRGQTSSARTIGIEAEHPGGSASWAPVQHDAYVRLCAALCRYLEVDPNRVCGHKEWALPRGRKTDPNFDMRRFRDDVRDRLAPPAPTSGDEMTPADWTRLERMLDDKLRILLRGEGRDGQPTGHDNLRAVRSDIAALDVPRKATS